MRSVRRGTTPEKRIVVIVEDSGRASRSTQRREEIAMVSREGITGSNVEVRMKSDSKVDPAVVAEEVVEVEAAVEVVVEAM